MANPENSSSSTENTPKPDIDALLAVAKEWKKLAIQEAKADIDTLEMYEKLPEDPKGWLEPFSHVQKGTSEFSPDFLKFSIDLLGKNFRLLDKFYKNAKPEHQQGILYIMGPFFDAFNNPENFTKDKDWNTFLSALVTPPADDGDSLIYDSSSMEKAHDAL